eukprot:63580_1
MGITASVAETSHKEKCGIICSCFINDKNVKLVNLPRNCRIKWIWSSKHQEMLLQTLKSKSYAIPKEIISLITTFTTSPTDDYYITKSTLFPAKTYPNKSRLLQKKLCIPYFSTIIPNHSLTIYLIGKHCSNIIQSFMFQYLPALHVCHSSSLARTVLIDRLPLRVTLIPKEYKYFNQINNMHNSRQIIYLLQCNDVLTLESITKVKGYDAGNINCVLFGNLNEKMMSNKYNVPYIRVNGQKDNEVNILFHFAVKYQLWFKQMNDPSVLRVNTL